VQRVGSIRFRHRVREIYRDADDGTVEHYVFPFTIVTVFTPFVGTIDSQ